MEKHNEKRNANPQKSQSNLSIESIYEMETNNYSDYSTETFESLEMAKDQDLLKDIRDIGNRPNKKQTKVNDTSKNIITNFKK